MKDNNLKIGRIILLGCLMVLFLLCFRYMNSRYDRLSRYPYKNEKARSLINKYLDDEEIEYIIEYAIDPSYFIDYVSAPSFNIYHVEEYKRISSAATYLNNVDCVEFTEEIYDIENGIDTAISLFPYYSFNDVRSWVLSIGTTDVKLWDDPTSLKIYLDDQHSVLNYVPNNLVSEESEYGQITLRQVALENLLNMLQGLEDQGLSSDISIVSSYLSASEIKKEGIYDIRRENQLGLSIDFDYGQDSELSAYKWLLQNAWQYGFIRSDSEVSTHWRYVGVDTADRMNKENLQLKDLWEGV